MSEVDPSATPMLPVPASERDKILLTHRLSMENRVYADRWESCCGLIVDRRLVVYLGQLVSIAAIMAFCIYQLITIDSCPDKQGYMSLLTLLIGLLCPSPVIPSNRQPTASRGDATGAPLQP